MSWLLDQLPLKEPTLLEPHRLGWLVGVGVVMVLAGFGLVGRARAVRAYFNRADPARFGTFLHDGRSIATLALSGLTLAFTVVGLARPSHDPKPRQVDRVGRDVVFAIDVSRSMLAQDLRPSRLERAKLAVGDVLDVMDGDRVGIVAFAGTAVLKCPLTSDYAFARMQLEELSPDAVSRGGTAIGDAVRASLGILFADTARGEKPPPRSRTIFLLTDGEDTESNPDRAAADAADKGVRIVCLGLGSESGSLLPPAPPPQAGQRAQAAPGVPDAAAPGTYMTFQGQPVRSKLEFAVLRRVAEATPGGVAINVGTSNIELDRVYERLMKSSKSSSFGEMDVKAYSELFQWAIGLALMAMLAEVFIHGLPRTK